MHDPLSHCMLPFGSMHPFAKVQPYRAAGCRLSTTYIVVLHLYFVIYMFYKCCHCKTFVLFLSVCSVTCSIYHMSVRPGRGIRGDPPSRLKGFNALCFKILTCKVYISSTAIEWMWNEKSFHLKCSGAEAYSTKYRRWEKGAELPLATDGFLFPNLNVSEPQSQLYTLTL